MKSKSPLFTLYLVGLYLLAVGVSFYVFSYLGGSSTSLTSPAGSTPTPSSGQVVVAVDPGLPRTASCPLNGERYTQPEQAAWQQRRPLTVMIENHDEARPQSGLQSADIVYEAVAEGAITRFMAVFYCDAISNDTKVGPVRSARTYFLDWASEYSDHPLYAHVGGANLPGPADALGQIVKYGWGGENDLNQFGLSIKECYRDDSVLKKANNVNHVATEHTMYCSSEALWKVGANRGWAATGQDGKAWTATFVPWKFADPKPVAEAKAQTISFEFWKNYKDYDVTWTYDPTTNLYTRSNGGKTHIDSSTNQPIQFRNIVIQFVTEKGPIDDHKHMLYGTTGTGKAKIFNNGTLTEATWTKKDRLSRTIFTDSKGKEIQFANGKIWIEELPVGNVVTVQ